MTARDAGLALVALSGFVLAALAVGVAPSPIAVALGAFATCLFEADGNARN